MNNNLLIISFHFPPSPGVGGRRWSKFVKYLSRNNSVGIHVISAKNTVVGVSSSYIKDIQNSNFKHLTLKPRYPLYMQNMEFPRKGILASIGFRLQRVFVMLFSKGNYFDYTVFWKKYFTGEIARYVDQHKINRVIISGPPFRYAFYSLELKKKFPHLKLFYDSRDPWCDVNHPPTVSTSRLNYEARLEKYTLAGVDGIFAVSEFQKKVMLTRCPDAAPIHVIRNGFDLEDLPPDLEAKVSSNGEIRLAHFGVMHGTKDYYWKPFVAALDLLKESNPQVFDKLVIDFIGLCPLDVLNAFRQTGIKVIDHGFQEMKNAYHLLNQCDIALWFKYDGSAGDYATKFGDYIALKKFIWTFSVKGEVTDYISKNHIGKVFYREDKNLTGTLLNELLKLDVITSNEFNPNFEAKDLELENLSKKIVEIVYVQH